MPVEAPLTSTASRHMNEHEWTEVKNGRGTGEVKIEPERSYVQCSNVYDKLAMHTTNRPPHEEEPATIAAKEKQP